MTLKKIAKHEDFAGMAAEAALAAADVKQFHHHDDWCDVIDDKAMDICDAFGVATFDQVTMEKVVEMIWEKLV